MNNPDSTKAIVLLSGGMDSLLCAAIAKRDHQEVAFLHINYGQRTESRELESFYLIAKHYDVPAKNTKVIDMSFLKEIGGSALTDPNIKLKKDSLINKNEIPNSYVPFRNSLFIALATSWAEVFGAKYIYIGAVEEDSSGYPDCRASYYKAYNELIKEGTKNEDPIPITIKTPLINFSKPEIIKKCIELEAPLYYSFSCYSNNKKACGLCDSCFLRLQAFKIAGQKDPIEYETPLT